MQETEMRLSDVFVLLLRKWRGIVCVALVAALLLGAGSVALYWISLRDPVQMERMEAEYEVAYNEYWDAIKAVDRQILNNENYMTQAEESLQDLIRKKENYGYDIEDLEADIEYYGLQIVDMEKNIEVLEMEKENTQYRLNYRNEQNESSLIMDIDPYDVKTSEIFIRVDADYQIIPGSDYQNPDPTKELLETYRLLVTNVAFYEEMIADLGIDTEVRYLTELISVTNYNENSLRIRVVGSDEALTKKMADYLKNEIMANHDSVGKSVAEHTLDAYSSRDYSVVNIDMYNKQQAYLMEGINLEAALRDLDAQILNVEAAIRQARADIRSFEDRIEENKIKIANLPVEESQLNEKISGYEKEIHNLRLQRLDLVNKKEPSKPGMSLVGAMVRFVKHGIIGAVVGVVLAATWIVLNAVLRNKVMSAKHITAALVAGYFGTWPEEKTNGKKNLFAKLGTAVDGFADRIAGTGKADAALVCANIAAAAGEKKVLLCGGAAEGKTALIAQEMKKLYPNVRVTAAGSVAEDSNAVTALAGCDAVVLVETLYGSNMATLEQTWERTKALDKEILGVVMA